MKQTIFSAIQPSGELHLGNYLGALKNFTELQNKYDCFFFIADYHSITENYDPKEKPKQIFDLALDFLAAGLDSKKCTLAIQSQIPEHTELAWIFNTITPISELQRMTQFKDKSQNQEKNINMGLFDYPVLQAADILMYKTDAVPVGQDQLQHIELARKIARFFNNKFGKTFPEPKDIITETPKIMSLTDPTKKMSKSHGPKSYIGINDELEVIRKKIKKVPTTTDIKEFYRIGLFDFEETSDKNIFKFKTKDKSGLKEVEKKPEIIDSCLGVNNLLIFLDNFGTEKNKKYFYNKIKNKQDIKFSELKDALANDISNYFAPFRKKRKELENKPDYVKKVLKEGTEKARVTARETIKEVREKIGLVF